MIHFIFDWPCKNGSICSDMFIEEFRKKRNLECDVDGSKRGKYRKFYWFLLALRTVLRSKKDDVIVCWLDFHGVLCFLFSKLLFRRRKILAINILLKKKNTLANKFNQLLYQCAFSSKDFYFTYTSKYMDYVGMERSYLLPDTYVDRNNLFEEYKDCGRKVFVGGNNGRDWNLAYNVAKILSDVEFCFVMPKCEKERNHPNLANVEEYYGITYTEYLNCVKKCSVVFLPLKTEAPAGLIVLYESAMKCKALIMTDTPVSRDYITNDVTGILVEAGNISICVENLNKVLNDKTIQKKLSLNLQQKVMDMGSFENYCKNLDDIIKDILKKTI